MSPALIAAAREAAPFLPPLPPRPAPRPKTGAGAMHRNPRPLEWFKRHQRMEAATRRTEGAALMERYRVAGSVLVGNRPVLPLPDPHRKDALDYVRLPAHPTGTFRAFCKARGLRRAELLAALARLRDFDRKPLEAS